MTTASFYRSSLRMLTLALLALVAVVKTGCDYSITEEPIVVSGIKLSVTPSTAEMQQGTQLALQAVISGYKTDGSVTWELLDQTGTLTANSLAAIYRAPDSIAVSPTTVRIRVRSVEDTARTATAVLTILDTTTSGGNNGGQVAITISPLSATIDQGQTQQFTATITGSTNTGVTWRLVSGPGQVSNVGVYIAPSTVVTTTQAVIEAASVADPAKTIRATVTVRKPVDPNLICFDRDVKPIFISNCTMSGCHSGSNPQEGLDFTTYEGILRGFEDDDADEEHNEILEKITEDDSDKRMPPPPMPRLSSAQIETIRKWIEQGAKNEDCSITQNPNDCDTVNVQFANVINPIFQNNCVGCHQGSNPPQGFSFTSHAGIVNAANSGRLIGAISHASGFTRMPMNGNKLDDCTIDKIKAWINKGMPNN